MKLLGATSMDHEMQSAAQTDGNTLAGGRAASLERDLLGRSQDDLRRLMEEIGEPAYRGSQLYHALYAERRLDFALMSNLAAALRERLGGEFQIGIPEIAQ